MPGQVFPVFGKKATSNGLLNFLSPSAVYNKLSASLDGAFLPNMINTSSGLPTLHVFSKHFDFRVLRVECFAYGLSYTLLDQVFSSITMDQDFYEKVIPGVGFQSPT